MFYTGMLEKAVFYAEYQSLTSQGHSGLEMIFTASLIGWEEGGCKRDDIFYL